MSADSRDEPLPDCTAAQAAAALAEGQALAPPTRAATLSAWAWALKDHCQALWTSEPAKVATGAAALHRLLALAGPAAQTPELPALAAWIDGMARLATGDMAAGLQRLEDAHVAFHTLAQPLPAAQTQVLALMALSMLGRHAEAAHRGQQAQRVLLAHGDVQSAAKLGLNLGSMLLHQDDYAAAAVHYREAGVLFARGGQMQHSVMADIGLADALSALGQFDDAQAMLARASQRAAHHGLPLLQAMAEESTALLALSQGRYAQALAGLEDSRRRYEALNLPQHLAVAEKQLADAYLELNLLPEALALYGGALARFEAQDMPQEQAWALVQQGRAQARLGQVRAAAASLARAGEVFAGQANRAGPGAVALARAGLALQNGQPEAALESAREAEAAYLAAERGDGPLIARLVQAQALAAQGSAAAQAQAHGLYQQVWRQAQAAALPQWQARAQAGLGLLAHAQGDAAAAQLALRAAVDALEDLRRTLPGDELRSALQADHLKPYEALLGLALDAAEAQSDTAPAVLQQLDRYRARTLGERLIAPRQASEPQQAAEQAAEQAQRTRLHWLYRRLRRSQEEGDAAPAALVEELQQTERRLLEQARRERLRAGAAPGPAAAGADAATAPATAPTTAPTTTTATTTATTPTTAPTAEERADDALLDTTALRQALGPQDAVLAYGVQGDELFACVVRPLGRQPGVELHRRLASWSAVQAAVHALRFQLESLGSGSPLLGAHLPSLQRRVDARLQALHALVWAPLAPALEGVRRVLVVPHGALAGVPFAALHDGGPPLGQRHLLAMAPSAQVALHGLVRGPVAARGGPAQVLADTRRLPHAAREAQAVAACHAGCRPLVDAAAVLQALQTLPADTAVLHVACHAQFRSDNPLFSALHLHDGAATAEWIETLQLPPATVVLSACETGLGAQGPGDESLGLVRAFLLAGAARVVASLWPVDDAATAAFMVPLHRALAGGAGCAQALQQAQAEVRATHPHPFYWAGFVAYGGC